MSNILSSSVGKKIIMSLSGLFLISFLIVHLSVNLASLVGPEAYDAACDFMDTNPIIKVMVPVLALGFIVHIVYAFILSYENRKARGPQGYAVSSNTPVGFAANNMLVLGVIIVGFLGLHLVHFWAKMQLQHFIGGTAAESPYALLVFEFKQLWVVLVYLVWFGALWFHLTHGFWSAFQSIGANNDIWVCRLKIAGTGLATLIFLGFAIVPLYFYFVL